MTDPEVVEWRFPVMLDSFAIRKGSGGKGTFNGGDGVVRRLQFLEPMTATILSSHRETEPYGLAGGEAGKCGKNSVVRKDGTVIPVKGNDEVDMDAGDVFVIQTPGGGGFGGVDE